MIEIGNWFDFMGAWLSTYTLVVLSPICIILAIIVYYKNRKRPSATIYGYIVKAMGSFTSMFMALIILLPLFARVFWGHVTTSGVIPQPANITASCLNQVNQYAELVTHSTVQITSTIVMAVLTAFIATVVWFISTILEVLKPHQ